MKVNVNPRSRLLAASKILATIGIELRAKSVAREATIKRIEELKILGEDETASILAVLDNLESFDDVVREQVKEMRTAERYEIVRKNFRSILDDAERMVNQVSEDGKLSFLEKMQNRVMEWRRGSIQSRFEELRNTSESVFADIDDQVKREMTVLEAYSEFRTALKESTILSEVLRERAEARKNEFAQKLAQAQQQVDAAKEANQGKIAIGGLEIARDEARRAFELEDRRYQTALDVSEQLNIAYGVAEGVMSRMAQVTDIKEAQQRKTTTFYTANSGTLTALMMAFTQIKGLHEGTQTHQALVDGTNEALERLASLGTQAQENAMRATYGATINASSLKKLFDSAVDFELKQRDMIDELRKVSSKNDEEVRKTIEEGQKKLADAMSRRHATTIKANTPDVVVDIPDQVSVPLETVPEAEASSAPAARMSMKP